VIAAIPDSFENLKKGPICVALTTVMPDGQPQTTVVWCNYDGTHVLVNTMSRFQKAKNMRANPKVTLFAWKRSDPLRYLEVRGTIVEMTEEGAMQHLDELTRQYTDKPHYYGYIFPEGKKHRETRIICKIRPKKINCDAIHK